MMIEYVHELQKKQFAPVVPTASARWQTWAVMLFAAFVVYLPAMLGAELLKFDDNFFFGPDNPEFVAGFAAVATQQIANAYLPVAHLSLWFDYQLGGGTAWLPHLHALLLHAVAGVILARLLLQLGVGRVAAHVVALLFLVHPSLCESVAWVSSRKYVLSGLFTFAALYQTVRFAHVPSLWRALALALLSAAAMFSNATAVVLPLLSVGVVLWSRGPRTRWLGPSVLFAVVVPIALYHQHVAADQGTLVAGDLMGRLPQAPGAFWHYLRTAVWPTRLNVLYPEVDTLALFREQWLVGVVAMASFVVLGVVGWFWRVTRPLAAGLLAFVIALLPFNTAYPASAIAAADRYLYLAVPGLALAVVAGSALVHRRGPWVAALLAVPLMWLAGVRAYDFRSEEQLWRSSLSVNNENAVAHYNLGVELWNTAVTGRRELPIEEYEQHLRAAIESSRYAIHELRARRKLLPLQLARAEYAEAADNALAAIAAAQAQLAVEVSPARIAKISNSLLRAQLAAFEPLQLSGNDEAAAKVLAAAKATAPNSPDVIAFQAMRELAARKPEMLALAADGLQPRLAVDDERGRQVDARLQAARDAFPNHAGLWLSQALWHQARDQVTAALRCYRKATELGPEQVSAWLGAARMLREKGLYESALGYAQKGWQHRSDPRLLQEIALSLVGLNNLEEAERFLMAYLRLEPEDRDSGKILANLLIGRAYTLLADHTQRATVRKLVADALRYNPDDAKAHLVLGRLAHEEKRYGRAVRHLEQAFKLLPTFDDAREQYARSLAALGFAAFINKKEETATDAWMRCVAIAPPSFDTESIQRQLLLAWGRLEARGIKRFAAGDREGAIKDFRRCLKVDPDQHWAGWLLATALHADPDADQAELEQLCRQAVLWQQSHELDASRQVYLLALTLQKRGLLDSARQVAADYLENPSVDASPKVLAALQQIAES